MHSELPRLIDHLLSRLAQVRESLGMPVSDSLIPSTPFSEIVDSMAMVEFLAIMAKDCGVEMAAIENAVQRRFTNVTELARCLLEAGLLSTSFPKTEATTIDPRSSFQQPLPSGKNQSMQGARHGWLAATSIRLPDMVQSADAINRIIGRPQGWLEHHAEIHSRRLWHNQDPVMAAVEAARECLQKVSVIPDDVGGLFVTSEAPPRLAGLEALLHHHLQLRTEASALQIGGACTGFLAALAVAQAMLPRIRSALIVTLEAPSQYLLLEPGEAGESAALFSDAAAACLVTADPLRADSTPFSAVVLGVDGSGHDLIQLHQSKTGSVHLRMQGQTLAARAIHAMMHAVMDCAKRHSLTPGDLHAVVAHGGNGRMPALLARQFGLAPERVWSETAATGNLGSASLPVAWHAHQPAPDRAIIWTSVGHGLTWGSVLSGLPVLP